MHERTGWWLVSPELVSEAVFDVRNYVCTCARTLITSVVYRKPLITIFFRYFSCSLCYSYILYLPKYRTLCTIFLIVHAQTCLLHVPVRGVLPLPSGARTYSQIHPKMCLMQTDT